MGATGTDGLSDNDGGRSKGRRKRANGEGSIYQRKDGRWAGAAYVLTDKGHQKRQPVYGKSWQEVHDKITDLKNKSQQGVPLEASTRLDQYMQMWLQEVCRPQLRQRTYENYDWCVRRHILPTLGKKTLRSLTPMHVRRLLNERRESGLSAESVRYIHAVLRSALSQAHRDGLVQRNVSMLVQPPRAEAHEIEPLTVEEAKQLLVAAEGTRLHALWVLALTLGLRRGELLGLTWSGLDLENGTLSVRQSVQRVSKRLVIGEVKTARSRRRLPLPEVAATALREHRRRQRRERIAVGEAWTDHDLIFCSEVGTPIDPRNLNRSFAKLLVRSGVRVTEVRGELRKNGERALSTWKTDLRLHDLRHTCASLLLALGVPMRVVMEILGHSQIGITSNLYTHVSPDVLKGSLDGMDGLFGT